MLSIGNTTIKSTLKRLAGTPGVGTYRIEFQLEWTPLRAADFAGAHLTFGGELEVGFRAGARLPLAQLQPIYPVAFPEIDRAATQSLVNLAVNIPLGQVEEIERQRSGGDIELYFQLQGTVYRPSSFDAGSPTDLVRPFWGSLYYPTKASDWLEVLRSWNYAQGFLLQVPMFTRADSVKALRAKVDLEKAVADMAEGRFRDAVSACRDALETAYGSGDGSLHPELEYKVAKLQEADKDARFWLVRRALWAVTNAAKHRDEITRDIEWERRDAAAVVTILSALLEQDPPL